MMKTWLKITLFCLSAFVFIGCDRVTKGFAKQHLKNKAPASYFHNTVKLVYAENTGAAMGLGDELPKAESFWLLGILPLAFLLGTAAYTIRHSKEMHFRKILSYALIISGGLGNIIDRIVYDRHVTDFMIFSIYEIQTGIFNFADVCVTAGAVGLLLFYRDKRTEKELVI